MLKCLLNDNEITCFDAIYNKKELKDFSKQNKLLCPICGKPYEYCHGKVIPPYFRHKEKDICYDKYSESETIEHLIGKQDLYKWVKSLDNTYDVVLEGYIESSGQRPDIMFKKDNKQYVIEFQCTPISSEYLERHQLYRDNNIIDIWICGVEKYLQSYHKGNGKKRVSTIEQYSKMYYNIHTKDFYKVINLDKKEFNKIIRREHIMKNELNYSFKKDNYILVKDKSVNYYSTYSYPSGSPSRKYRYPVASYHYHGNFALGKCIYLYNMKIN